MKQNTSFLKRCFAMFLALLMVVSGSNIGVALQVSATGTDVNVSAGKLVADNYELTAEEEALLSSGMLAGETYGYTVPTNSDLITVDTENATIAAEKDGQWVPTTAYIVNTNGDIVETITLADGIGSYDPAVGNAFSVKVRYELSMDVPADVQETLLNTSGWLNSGVAALKAGYDASNSSLGTVVLAMDTLKTLADGITMDFGAFSMSAKFEAPAAEAVSALRAQMSANGDKLDLQVANSAYAAAASKVEYLLNNGADYKETLCSTYELLLAIKNDPLANNTLLDGYLEGTDPTSHAAWMAFKDILNGLVANMEPVTVADWTAAETGTELVNEATVDYAKLDQLVAALTTITAAPTVKNPLLVAETTIQKNLSMFNVEVVVELKAVKNNVVVVCDTKTTTLTLAEGTHIDEVLTQIDASGFEAAALAEWDDVYAMQHFDITKTELPDYLTQDITYTITYSPVEYTVDIAGEVNDYPYGYIVTLPVHDQESQSYDYYDADGNYYAQGSEILVDKDMTFTRSSGKAYTEGKLLTILANNYAGENAKVNAILTSGALNVDESFSYRKPSAEELETLVTLTGNVLTAGTYPSSYKGLSWAADTYVVDGTTYEFNGATQVTISGEFDEVHVYYSLVLTNYSKADVKEIFDLVVTLNDEAEGQLSVLNRLAGFGEQMSMLNMTMMQGLQMMVKNEEMKAIISSMMDPTTGCFDAEGNLILNNIIAAYNDPNNGGLYYYYTNDALVRGEVEKLSQFLNQLLGKEEYKQEIETLLGNMGFGDYAAKLDELGTKLDEVSKMLVAKNAAIVTSDRGALRKLSDALTQEGDVVIAEYDSPYISMEPVIRVAEKFAAVTINVSVNGIPNTNPITAKVLKGETLSTAQVAELKAAINAFVAGTGINTKYYETNYNAAELDALAVNGLESNITLTYTWVKATYAVNVPGAEVQYVDIDNRTITLPAHPDALFGMSYEYTVDGQTAAAGIYTLSVEQLDKLIAGELVITRTEKNVASEKLVTMVNDVNKEMGFVALTLVEKDGKYTGINVDMGIEDMMNFVMGMVMKSGYNYIGLNNEGFKYATADGLEISIQTLVNAILNDEGFNNDRVIALAENGKGNVVTTTMQLGNSAAEINYSLTFTLNLKSVPAALTNNAAMVKTVSNYIKFQSNEGKLAVSVNLPDKVYGAYAAALIATGNVDKTDVNELTQKVAIQFVYDYLTAITGSEADMVTFTNTMKMLGLSQDLTGYNKYYTAAIDAYNAYVEVEISDNGAAIDVAAPGKASIDALLKLSGTGTDGIADLLVMIKEYKAGGTIDVSIDGDLKNPEKSYYALILDAEANGVANKFEAPSSVNALQNQLSTLAGASAVILLDDVDGNLTIGGTTVLDLNGKNVTGTINATGKLYIIDSSMGTYNAGTVGSVTGNAVIIAGNYNADVSSFLKDGYYMDGTTVRNTLYYITDENGTVTFRLDADIENGIPSVKALAIDIAADLMLNYMYTASLTVNGYNLIDVQIDDVLGIFAERDVNNLAKQLLACVTIGEAGYENKAGFEGLVNEILDDLIDFETISAGLLNNEALVTYEITTEPWEIELEHVVDGDYMTVNVTSNDDLAKNFKVALAVESKYNKALGALTGELANIVEDRTDIEIDFPAPTYSDKRLSVVGAGKAEVYVDMSQNSDYAVMIGVILAYGNEAKREAVAAAINSGNINDLKPVVDGTSVKELFTALKVMARNVDFQAMADAVGVTVDVKSAAELENLFHLILCGAGKALETLDITGMNSKLGNLYNEQTGYYELAKEDVFRNVIFPVRSYEALFEATIDIVSLNVKLFAETECLWGDADHDGDVDGDDATLILQYELGVAPADFCTERTDVDGNGLINGDDATLVLQYELGAITEFPVEK